MANTVKVNGRDFNFFSKLSVTNTTFSTVTDGYRAADMVITFPTQGVLFLNEGTGVVEYSFNGTTIHGELDSTLSSKGLAFDNRTISMIWWRVKSGSSGPITISVQAWS